MKTRTLLIISMVLNVGLLGWVALLTADSIGAQRGKPSTDRISIAPAEMARERPHFGPTYEAALKGTLAGRPELFDLERGRSLVEPRYEIYNDPALALHWILSAGMDISAVLSPNIVPCAVTYYMAVVPCENQTWESITATDVIACRALAEIQDPKRRCVALAGGPRCFMFRTHTGSYGLMELRPAKDAIVVRYKFALEPDRPLFSMARDQRFPKAL